MSRPDHPTQRDLDALGGPTRGNIASIYIAPAETPLEAIDREIVAGWYQIGGTIVETEMRPGEMVLAKIDHGGVTAHVTAVHPAKPLPPGLTWVQADLLGRLNTRWSGK